MEMIWTDDMGEISGFGGSYERGCRAMVLAGAKYLEEHPEDKDYLFRGFKNVFGLLVPENEAAKRLENAILDATIIDDDGKELGVRKECTGAMLHAAIQHSTQIAKHGWEWYQNEMRNREK